MSKYIHSKIDIDGIKVMFTVSDGVSSDVIEVLQAEFEISDVEGGMSEASINEYRAYLPNSGMMLYVTFQPVNEDKNTEIYRQVALTVFAKENDIIREF